MTSQVLTALPVEFADILASFALPATDGPTRVLDATCHQGHVLRRLGTAPPALCDDPRLRPIGECRMCSVEIDCDTEGQLSVSPNRADFVEHPFRK